MKLRSVGLGWIIGVMALTFPMQARIRPKLNSTLEIKSRAILNALSAAWTTLANTTIVTTNPNAIKNISRTNVSTKGIAPTGTVSATGAGGVNTRLELNGALPVNSGAVFKQMQDIVFYNNISLNAQWTFTGSSIISGNGGILDLSGGGSLRVKEDSSLLLRNMVIRGISNEGFLFDAPSSQMRLSGVTLELDSDCTFTTGGIYVEGPTTIVTGGNVLTMSAAASMTVDQIALLYDTLDNADAQNIQPTVAADTNHKNVISLKGGVIRTAVSSSDRVMRSSPDRTYNSDSTLSDLVVLAPTGRFLFTGDATLDGQGFTAQCSRSDEPLIIVSDDVTATLTNISLTDFSPSYISLGTNSQLIFGDGTSISLSDNQDLTSTYTFRGQCSLDAGSYTLDLSNGGNLIVQGEGSSLQLANILVTGFSGNRLRCTDDTCTVTFNGVRAVLDDHFTFTTGRFEVLNNLDVVGTYTWTYASAAPSRINAGAQWLLDRGVRFSYEPSSDNRDLIVFDDSTAVLEMQGATLASTTTGMRLTRGTLRLDHINYIDNPGAVSASEAVSLGNGNADDDVNVVILPGASFNLQRGRLAYRNVAA